MAELRNKSSFWMEATCAFTEKNDKGFIREVKEKYVVEASTFIDGEQRIRDEFNYANRPLRTVSGMIRPKYGNICFSDDASADSFYKVKVGITEQVEVRTRKGGTRTKEKVVSHFYLVQSSSVEGARQAIKDVVYKDSTEDYEIMDIVKTRILDVLEKGEHLKNVSDSE